MQLLGICRPIVTRWMLKVVLSFSRGWKDEIELCGLPTGRRYVSHSILRVPNIDHDILFMISICLYNIGFHLVLFTWFESCLPEAPRQPGRAESGSAS
jgi:hypothetical protein